MWLTPLLAALVSATGPSATTAPPRDAVAEAIVFFKNFDDQQAAAVLREVLAGKPAGEVAAKAHLYLGLIALNALKPDAARAEFRLALEADGIIELPADATPKAALIFSAARRDLERDYNRRDPSVAPAARASAPTAAAVPAPEAAVNAPPEPPPRNHVLSFALAAAGLACEGVAIYGGVQLVTYNSTVGSATPASPQSGAALESAQGPAKFWAAGWIVFAATGAAALGGAALAW